MNYEILKGGTGLLNCLNNATCGVSRNVSSVEEKQIFQQIWQTKKIDYYICPYCIYKVIGHEYDILFKDINMIERVGNKLFLKLIDGQIVEVNRQSFSIKCTEKCCHNPEAIVQEYTPHKNKKDS